ncbi:MAG: SpoIVB peptidase [Lachnospiraceae bacterium]|nr:SpoIVB peptidase [Lachnospiraceae bacterium]
MKRLKVYRIILIVVLVINLLFLGYSYYTGVESGIPSSLKVYVGKESRFDFGLPVEADITCDTEVLAINNASNVSDKSKNIHFSLMEPFTVKSDKKGRYEVSLRLFGLLNLKKVSIDVIEVANVIPCGNTVGIRVDLDGLLVLGTGAVQGMDGLEYEPAYQVIRTGDYIVKVNNKKITSIKKMQRILQNSDKDEVVLTIRRNNVLSKIKLPVIESENGEKKLGIWVRADTQGIGTLTFAMEDGSYGALGHGITDSDTGVLVDVGKGYLYETEIVQVVKGKKGEPGEIMGMILETNSKMLGTIESNTHLGISGILKSNHGLGQATAIPIGFRQDIKKGNATVICQVDDAVKSYKSRIVEIDRGSEDNKGFIIEITDENLLSKTGGIVRGMSGSPVIQNGKLVGAVTHVMVNDSTRGYGIFIENMLEH